MQDKKDLQSSLEWAACSQMFTAHPQIIGALIAPGLKNKLPAFAPQHSLTAQPRLVLNKPF